MVYKFMELFLSVWELIKTLNLFVCIFEHNPESWPRRHRECPLPVVCFSQDLSLCIVVPDCSSFCYRMPQSSSVSCPVTRCFHVTLGHLVAALLSCLWSPSAQRWKFLPKYQEATGQDLAHRQQVPRWAKVPGGLSPFPRHELPVGLV